MAREAGEIVSMDHETGIGAVKRDRHKNRSHASLLTVCVDNFRTFGSKSVPLSMLTVGERLTFEVHENFEDFEDSRSGGDESTDDDDAKDGHGDAVSSKRKRPRKNRKNHGDSRRTKRRRKSASPSPSEEDAVRSACCVCRRPPSGKMIKCGNSVCKIGSFHVSCMRLFKGTPTLKWYCKQCRRYPSKSSIIKPEFKNFERNDNEW